MKKNELRPKPAMGGKLCMGGSICCKNNRVIVERTDSDTTTVTVPEGHAVTVRMMREGTSDLTTVCFETQMGGWSITLMGYGALLNLSPGDWCEFTAVNNALALYVDLGEVWNVAEARAA